MLFPSVLSEETVSLCLTIFPLFFCPLIIDPAGRAVPAGAALGYSLVWIRFAMNSITLLSLTVTILLHWANYLRLHQWCRRLHHLPVLPSAFA